MLDGQRPDEVVESAAQIIDRLAHEEAEFCWRLLEARGVDGPLGLARKLKVYLVFNFVRVLAM